MKLRINWEAWVRAAATMAAIDKLPEPEIDVDIASDGPSSHRTTITGRRDGANAGQPKSWEGYGTTVPKSVEDAVRRFIRDPVSDEFRDPKPKPSGLRLMVLLVLVIFTSLVRVALADDTEPKPHFPVSGHTAKDFTPPIATPVPPEHPNRALVAPHPLTGDSAAPQPCHITIMPGASGTVSCVNGTLTHEALPTPPLGRPPIGTVMEGPGLK